MWLWLPFAHLNGHDGGQHMHACWWMIALVHELVLKATHPLSDRFF
jgi:hypothetical protein